MIQQPLVVDLDGTLIHTDMLHESALRVLRDSPLKTLQIPFLLTRGKAHLKKILASHSSFDPALLPYNEEFITWLREQRNLGRSLILCTASDESIAHSIAKHLKIFDDVIASDGLRNLSGGRKAEALIDRFDHAGYDYAGNSESDVPVWSHARKAIVVNGSQGLINKAKSVSTIERIFEQRKSGFTAWRTMLRSHQWLKNLLVFVPLFAAHDLRNEDAWASLVLAFIAFSLCASAVYIANDLLDLESDRMHPRKRHRPLSSGLIPAWTGALVAPVILSISMGLATQVTTQFATWLLVYFALTCAYSWLLKRIILVDCLTLALLYTVRIVAGASAVGHQLSFWLLAFSVFLFLSLAFVKRYAELEIQAMSGNGLIHGRGYRTTDAPLIQTMGIVSGYTSVLVMALYLNSDAVLKLYSHPELIWGAVPTLLFWVSWMWMQAHRGNMHDDPIVFAVKDPASVIAGAIFAMILFAGATGLPW